jgi:hypothetical protein
MPRGKSKESRVSVISAVTDHWRLLALIVLVSEAGLSAAYYSTDHADPIRKYYFPIMIIFLGLIVAGIFLAIVLSHNSDNAGGSRKPSSDPNISGRWEGWSYRSLAKEWRPCAQEFKQSGGIIIANAWGPQNWAQGLSASLVYDGAAHELIWSYRTRNTDYGGRPGDSHLGTHFLKYSERDGQKYLEGRYITDRIRDDQSLGSVGFQRFVWVSPQCKSSLAFQESTWGFPKPPDNP